MLFVRHQLGAYGAALRGRLPLSRHWWAGFKPWMEVERLEERHVADPSAFLATLEVLQLAKLYDYVVQLAPLRRPAPAAQQEPRCVALHRRFRRRIEQSEHFDEVAAVWQQHMRDGDGYCAWPTLPGEPVSLG